MSADQAVAIPPASILIVGDGLLGWLAAGSLAQVIGADAIRVVPVDHPQDGLGSFGPALLALPRWRAQALGQPPGEDALFGSAEAGWALGIGYGGWSGPAAASFWPFGEIGVPLRTIAFHQLVARMRAEGRPMRTFEFSLAALAAQAGRSAPPSADPRSPLSTLEPGLLVDADGLARAAREAAMRAGVRVLPPLAKALAGDRSRIESLRLVDGTQPRARLYVDCTGTRRSLIDTVAPGGFASWGDRLLCDRLSVRRLPAEPARSFPIHQADLTGWTARTPLPGSVVAARWSSSAFGGEGDAFASGAHLRPWCGNVVALGAAAMLVEPLHALPLMMAQDAIALLATLLPATDEAVVEAAEYNRITTLRHARALDLAQLPYRLNGRHGDPFWDAARAIPVSDELAWKLALFTSRGRVPMLDEEPLDRADWLSLLETAALRQRRYDPLADAIPLAEIEAHLVRLRERLVATVRQMPPLAQPPQTQRRRA